MPGSGAGGSRTEMDELLAKDAAQTGLRNRPPSR
jgi:hypothetical protein